MKNKVYILAAAMTACLAVGACSGDDSPSMPQVPANPDALCAIIPHTINIPPVDMSQTPITRSDTGKPEQKATYAENLGVNYSAEVTLEAAPQEAQTRAGAGLATDAQYRIVVFDDNTGEIKGNVVYKQGSPDVVDGEPIKIKAGKYRLFAYTFNSASTTTIRDLDADKKNVTVNNGEDFMTYTDNNYIVRSTDFSSGKRLDISFVRQCIRLTVRVIIQYNPGTPEMKAASLKIGNIFGNGSKWNGFANTNESKLTPGTGTASLTNEKIKPNQSSYQELYCGPTEDDIYLITSPCSDQIVTISDLKATINGKEKTSADFDFVDPITLTKGGSYCLTINIHNYYVLTRTATVTINGIKWARTNLKQTGSGYTAPVTIVDNPWDKDSNGYWNWGMRDATSEAMHDDWSQQTPGPHQDPCRSYNPSWRLPNVVEMESLIAKTAPKEARVKINTKINTITGNFFPQPTDGWAPDAKGCVCIDNNQVLFIPVAGFRSDGTSGASSYYASSVPNGKNVYCMTLNTSSKKLNIYTTSPGVGFTLRCIQE